MNRVLVVTKAGFLGDTIVATPMLRSLRAGVPKAEITLLTGPAGPALLAGCPYIDNVWSHPRPKHGRVRDVLRLAKRIRSGRFEVAILADRSLRSALTVRLAGVPRRIGHATEYRAFLLTDPVRLDISIHVTDCLQQLLGPLDVSPRPGLPELWVSQDERQAARDLLAENGLRRDAAYVALCPAAKGKDVREWPAERYAEVADHLVQHRDLAVVLIGTAEEAARVSQVEREMSQPVLNLAGRLGLRQALSLIAEACLRVGNDGALHHAAVALGVPSVSFFVPTRAVRWAYHTPRHRTLVGPAVSAAPTDSELRASLDGITVQQALDAIEELLTERSRAV
jgi:heptosyltransferase-2